MSFYGERWIRKTRKPHYCLWCDSSIEAGSTTRYESGMWEGDFWHGHLHPECAAASEHMVSLRKEVEFGGWSRGRCDDSRQPPTFSPDYRGGRKQRQEAADSAASAKEIK